MSRPWLPSSASAAPLEDDDLLSEVLLRLPPQPSSLPRASLVCKRWRRLVSNPGFVRRFRIHHRRNPPLLGFFGFNLNFIPAMEPPNRLPEGHFSLHLDGGDDPPPLRRLLECRHGLVLVFLPRLLKVVVWDPVTGDQRRIALPPGFAQPDGDTWIHGAVLRTCGDDFQFQVVMVAQKEEQEDEEEEEEEGDEEEEEEEGDGEEAQQLNARAVAQVYSSETSTWGDLISTSIPSTVVLRNKVINTEVPSVLVGNSLYWLLCGSLLEFDLYKQGLSVDRPCIFGHPFSLMRADGADLGCLTLLDFKVRFWKRKTDRDGVASWLLGRSIKLDKLLSINPEKMRSPPRMVGFAEDNNVVLIWTEISLFAIQLDSLEFKNIFQTKTMCHYYALESVYTAGTVIGGGDDRSELLPKT